MRRTASHSRVCIPGDCHTPAIRSSAMDRSHLSPAQRAVIEDLMDLGGERPTFRDDLADDLRATLESELEDLFETPRPRPLIVRKDDLSRIHSCESYFQAASFPGWNH